ncbi:MAG: HIT family protein [Rhizobiaceae bacterium]|nr:HIT family protein [Rhizobiaceae bacterium]
MSTDPYDNDNVFAKILRGDMPSFKVHEDEHVLCFMDIMPRGKGHSLVIPKAPCRNLLDAEPEVVARVHRTAQKVARAAMKAFSADGITIQQFNEDAGGQEVYHYHVHVIPRFSGVKMGPPGVMGDMDEIRENGEKLAGSLED